MRPLSAVIDRLAQEVPDAPWVKIPTSSGWKDFTWQQLQKAVDSMAHWIDQELGPPAGDEHIAYTGVNDLRYPITTLAAEKTGYKILLSSPRNSLEGHAHLLAKTDCHRLLHSSELKPQVRLLKEITTIQVPSLESLIDIPHPVPPYKTKCPANPPSDFIVLTLHSSGTTSLPKPIPVKAGVFAIADSLTSTIPTPPSRLNTHDPLYTSRLLVSMPPFFHAFGWNMLLRSIYYQKPIVLLPPGVPPTAELMVRAIEETNPTGIVATPSILEDICALKNGLDILTRLEYVYFGGAPLAKECGDVISKKTRLVNGMGTTEVWNVTTLVPLERGDWEYFEWNEMAGVVMEPVDGGGDVCELVIKRREGEDGFQFVFRNFEQLSEWRTRDLYERHWDKEKKNLWKYVCRRDDVIVLSNGEKINPVLFEKEVEGCPLVKGVLMAGERRFQTGLIVEPRGVVEYSDEFVEQIWPWVEKANEKCPAHGRVWKSMIMLTAPEKPFQRTPKATVMRHKTVELYREEIDYLFSQQESQDTAVSEEMDAERVRNIVRKAILTLSAKTTEYNDETNLFKTGFDSLKVLQLIQTLRKGLPPHLASGLSTRLVYENPSTAQLVSALFLSPISVKKSGNSLNQEKISAMINKYATIRNPFDPEPRHKHSNSIPWHGNKVILTGSTGSLGTYLLHALLCSPSITHIFCINRTADAAERQTRSFSARGLPPYDTSRVTFLHVDLPTLSQIPEALIDTNGISLIIHNAWPVDFNLPLDSFASSIAGTANLINVTESRFTDARLVFISSVSTVFGVRSVQVPEKFISDHHDLPLPQGYAQSKHVASCLLARAVQEGRVKHGTVLRVGQLAGPNTGKGVWNKSEWVPLLVATSLELGMIPAQLGGRQGRVDWLPVDLAAEVIVELVSGERDEEKGVECWNVVNPKVGDWGVLAKAVKNYYEEKGKEVKIVSPREWVQGLKRVAKEENDGDKYPALKLLDFFEEWDTDENEGEVVFETRDAMERSETLREMKPVGEETMGRWLDGWRF
ncbi:hypothetical protein QBC44DRAFT_293882 [Cladorrhinum sp. PSN332]|nr:hypothetical protein QBC44DRAFT_293882 [Cladorrhinum sp. PSN332]